MFLPVDGADGGDIVLRANSLSQEPVPDLPCKHCWVVLLVLGDGVNHVRGGYLRLGAPNHTGLEVPRLVKSGKKLKQKKVVSSMDDTTF